MFSAVVVKPGPELRFWHTGVLKWRAHAPYGMVWTFALAPAVDAVMACPRARPRWMNFAYAQERVALLPLRLFCVEAFTISSLCHRLNYLSPFLIHTSAVPVWSLWLHCKLHTFTDTKQDMKISFLLILELDKFKTQPLTSMNVLTEP